MSYKWAAPYRAHSGPAAPIWAGASARERRRAPAPPEAAASGPRAARAAPANPKRRRAAPGALHSAGRRVRAGPPAGPFAARLLSSPIATRRSPPSTRRSALRSPGAASPSLASPALPLPPPQQQMRVCSCVRLSCKHNQRARPSVRASTLNNATYFCARSLARSHSQGLLFDVRIFSRPNNPTADSTGRKTHTKTHTRTHTHTNLQAARATQSEPSLSQR